MTVDMVESVFYHFTKEDTTMSLNFKKKHMLFYLTIMALFFTAFLVKEQPASATIPPFTQTSDFSRYGNNVEFGPNEVYGYSRTTLTKMNISGAIIWEYNSITGTFTSGTATIPVPPTGELISNSARIQDGHLLIGTNNGSVLVFSNANNVLIANCTRLANCTQLDVNTLLKKYQLPTTNTITSAVIGANNDVFVIDNTYVHAFEENGTAKSTTFYPNGTPKQTWPSKHSVADFGYYATNNVLIPRSNDFFITSVAYDLIYSSLYWINTQDGSIPYYKRNIKPLFTDEVNNILYYSQGRTLYAVQLNDGREIWRSELNKGTYVNSLAVAPDGTLYVGMADGPFYALDAVTHAVKWQSAEGNATWGNIIVDQQQNIYVAQDYPGVQLSYIVQFSPFGGVLHTLPVNQSASNLQKRTDNGSLYFTFNDRYYSSSVPNVTTNPTLNQLTPSAATVQLTAGGMTTVTLLANYSDQSTRDVTTQATWNSSNPRVATVSNGRINAVTAGSASITATLDGKLVTIPVTVTANQTVQSLMISPTMITIQEVETKYLTVSARYSDGSIKNVTSQATWKSNKTRIVTANNGLIKGITPGTATITVSFAGKIQTVTVNVTMSFSDFTTERTITDQYKEWTIRFNLDINQNTLTNDNIYIIDSSGKRISTTITDRQSRSVKVKPNEAYNENQTYTLHVTNNVYSLNNKQLTQEIKIPFVLQMYQNDFLNY